MSRLKDHAIGGGLWAAIVQTMNMVSSYFHEQTTLASETMTQQSIQALVKQAVECAVQLAQCG